jgi:protein O-GlcNAc transferase
LLAILQADPFNILALRIRSFIAGEEGRFEEAISHLNKILTKRPRSIEDMYYKAMAYAKLKKFDDAVTTLEATLIFAPTFFEGLHDLGTNLLEIGKFQRAVDALEKATQLRPDVYQAHFNLGIAFGKLGQYEEELKCYNRAKRLNPGDDALNYNIGLALLAAEHHKEAIHHFDEMLQHDPHLDFPRGALLNAKMYCGRWDGIDVDINVLRQSVKKGSLAINPFHSLSLPFSREEQLTIAEIYARQTFTHRRAYEVSGLARTTEKRIRIAYVSSDFYAHATSYLIVELFERHNREQFEVFGISFGPDDGSAMRERVRNSFDHFLDVRNKSNEEISDLMRSLGIDIAIDLKGYTTHGRPEIFSLRAAPVQVNMLGYPGTMGCDFIDYLIADKVVIPEGHQQSYSEKIVFLPDCYQPNDSKRDISSTPAHRSEEGLPDDAFVFCSFNNSYKITPEFFAIWMRLLKQVDGSVLWLLARSSDQEAQIRAEAKKHDVDAHRIIFAKQLPLPRHLRRLQFADLVLDNLPYNAHTTASDALWAGVPLLTCIGDTFAGRVAASLLRSAGLSTLITLSKSEYEQKALELANSPISLQTIRTQIAEKVKGSRLFDIANYTAAVEQAYMTMMQRHRRGEPLADIYV